METLGRILVAIDFSEQAERAAAPLPRDHRTAHPCLRGFRLLNPFSGEVQLTRIAVGRGVVVGAGPDANSDSVLSHDRSGRPVLPGGAPHVS
jgi:adenine deaminase